MEKKKKIIIALFVLGVVFTLGAPYFPTVVFDVIRLYDYHFQEIRWADVIPSIRTCGIVFSLLGIAILFKK